jgi:SAM-dependent methyltransferase
MRDWLAELLAEPVTGAVLSLEAAERGADGEIEAGALVAPDGARYEVRGGIPRFATVDEASQTSASFSFKWSRQESYQSDSFRAWYTAWLLAKYGFESLDAAGSHFASRRRVLEIGCGSGLSGVLPRAALGTGTRWVGLDLTDAVDVARSTLGDHPDAGFVQADLMAPPFRPATFDAIFTEGVLHHTPSTERALASAASLLAPGGEILFYVYARKAPLREWTDDYIRSLVSGLPAEEAWDMMRPLTSLARALSDLHVSVEVPEDVPLLGIKAGRHDVQRLIYWHFAKLYWNDEMGFEGSQHVNFDWYHPPYAHRHSLEEIRAWCARLGLEITYCHTQESGYTIRATKG